MRCRKCQNKAVINMRQHKLALCKEHFPVWIQEQTDRLIHKYGLFSHQDTILVAVSGGKDSLSLWDILHQLGYQADGLYIDLGIDEGIGYSAESRRLSREFAEHNNLKLIVIDVPGEYGKTIPQFAALSARGWDKPCAVCGLSKRHIMNRVAFEQGYAVLVTGHNLDDEAAVLFGNTLNWQTGYLQHQAPLLPARSGLARKAKPLCRFYEREMAAYALVRNISYIYDECPYARGSKSIQYKELLNQLEVERPGAKLQFYLSFLQAKEKGFFNSPDECMNAMGDPPGEPEDLHCCSRCGQLTSAPGECAFCRMLSRVSP